MTTKPTLNAERIEDLANQIRDALPPNKQEEVFRLAAEAGYLTALADGTEDEEERKTLIESIEQLSKGLVLEWEVEQVLEGTWARVQADGADACAAAIGKKLGDLKAAEAGLFVAALVALATAGLHKREADTLAKIGKAAGLAKSKVGEIVKRAK